MNVVDRLKKHILVDGFHIVVDLKESQDSWIVDKETGKKYLDCYSQFASQPLGWNHKPFLEKDLSRLHEMSIHKIANSDMYSEAYADFIEEFSALTPNFEHYFFIEGGALGVENALKAAFDWKYQRLQETMPSSVSYMNLDVIHFKEAFHGRTGYTLSLTNNGGPDSENMKTKWFPKFNWTRVINPKINGHTEEEIIALETEAVHQMHHALSIGNVAAIIIEPIQGEGGDNHFRKEFFVKLRELADEFDAMLIFDEVQCGMGLTGRTWCHEHFGVIPDMMCFGKKSQVCGFCATKRIDSVSHNVFKQSGRINSTWGGNFVDMERSRLMIQVMNEQNLVHNARVVGGYFFEKLKQLESYKIHNTRFKGLMIAIDCFAPEYRDALIDRLHNGGLLALKCGPKSIRFRPHLTFSSEDADQATEIIKAAL